MSIWFGPHVADDSELRLCGDLAGKRAIELGVASTDAPGSNAVEMAAAGAKAIAVDPHPDRIASVREQAAARSTSTAEIRVECHTAELADLGFATSASVDLVLAANTLGDIDDLPRLLRQVHRVLKPDAAFVISITHPVAAMFDDDGTARRPYGADGTSFADLYMAMERSNFHLDQVHELGDRRQRTPMIPSQLVVRARKLGV
jgi:SAM-dependent methyltransferase